LISGSFGTRFILIKMLLEAIEMTNKTRLVTAIGAVAGASFAAGAVAADQAANPFQADDLDTGLSQIGDKGEKEGACGEGSCGEGHDKDKDKDKEGACGEGSCGEGSCGEGSCGEGEGEDEEKDKEGACGEGSCGEGSCGAA
jgi:uncharacterized low-complexity protein